MSSLLSKSVAATVSTEYPTGTDSGTVTWGKKREKWTLYLKTINIFTNSQNMRSFYLFCLRKIHREPDFIRHIHL